jgi:hypothetical protein
LIAQVTATVTDSVSSPCAIGVEVAIGAAAFGNTDGRAERDAGGLGVDLGLAAGVGDRPFASVVEQF